MDFRTSRDPLFDRLRDPRKKPELGDRFLNPLGDVVEVVGIGTKNYKPFATIQRYTPRKHGEPMRAEHVPMPFHVWWTDLLRGIALCVPIGPDDLRNNGT